MITNHSHILSRSQSFEYVIKPGLLVYVLSVLEFDSKDRQKDWEKGSGKAKVKDVYFVRN